MFLIAKSAFRRVLAGFAATVQRNYNIRFENAVCPYRKEKKEEEEEGEKNTR